MNASCSIGSIRALRTYNHWYFTLLHMSSIFQFVYPLSYCSTVMQVIVIAVSYIFIVILYPFMLVALLIHGRFLCTNV
jgi:hypothetical protein